MLPMGRITIWFSVITRFLVGRRWGMVPFCFMGTHRSTEDAYFQKTIAEMVSNDCRHVYTAEAKAINVGCMQPWVDYEPRSLKELLDWTEAGS